MECRGVVLGLLMGLLVLSGEVVQSEGAVPCGTVVKNTAPCLAYVKGTGPKPARNSPCCTGVRALDSLASVSVQNRRNICNCIQGAVKGVNPSPQAVASLPGLCGTTHSFSISLNCNKIP